ncbi:hypothetical protein [Massilia eburnea]|uniref:hypothetical protein n=1 Tax=Massilia eburnea TaxID=1776165 RepID=UPI003D6A496E
MGAAAGQLVVTSEGRLENTGTLAASKGMQVNAREAVENKGKMQAGEDLALKSASVTNTGSVYAGGQLVAAVTGDVDNRSGSIEARRVELSSASGTLLNGRRQDCAGRFVPRLNVNIGSTNNSDGVLGQAAASTTDGTGGSTGTGTGEGTSSGGADAGTGGTTGSGSTGGNGTGTGTNSGGTPVPSLPAGRTQIRRHGQPARPGHRYWRHQPGHHPR